MRLTAKRIGIRSKHGSNELQPRNATKNQWHRSRSRLTGQCPPQDTYRAHTSANNIINTLKCNAHFTHRSPPQTPNQHSTHQPSQSHHHIRPKANLTITNIITTSWHHYHPNSHPNSLGSASQGRQSVQHVRILRAPHGYIRRPRAF
jgi:hypothetical protein